MNFICLPAAMVTSNAFLPQRMNDDIQSGHHSHMELPDASDFGRTIMNESFVHLFCQNSPSWLVSSNHSASVIPSVMGISIMLRDTCYAWNIQHELMTAWISVLYLNGHIKLFEMTQVLIQELEQAINFIKCIRFTQK